MPRSLILAALALVVVASTATALITGVDSEPPEGVFYELEVDNAFGLTDGSDLKVAGVRAGIIDGLKLDQRTRRAVVGLRLTQPGFDELRADAFCQVRPQSLIGEYYLDCRPGRGRRLAPGTRLDVTHSGSAIGLDLLNTVLRRPYNERLRILLGELGAGVAARGPDLNAAIARAVPALRETNGVLAQLAAERTTIADLIRDGERALADLARRRRDVTRFVDAAGRLNDAGADQERALGEQFDRFPAFLRELVPSMRALGRASASQAAALADLSADAPQLTTLFTRLGAFSRASVPAIEALGEASRTGSQAADDARPVLRLLAQVAEGVPELARNARFVGEHLDDRANAVEPDGRSPGGEGFTGLEAILQYVFNQSLSTNVRDASGYLLKVNLLAGGACGTYADAEAARANPECSAGLGPTQPGVTTADPTADGRTPARRARARARTRTGRRGTAPPRDAAPVVGTAPVPANDVPALTPVPGALPLPVTPDQVTGTAGALLDHLLRP